MFEHSIKVPRLYKTASKIAKDVSESKGSIKQLVYESKHPNIKALYALIVHTFQRTDDLERLLKKSKLLIKEPRFDPWLAKILITELLWGKKRLSGQAKPVKTILGYEQIFRAHLSDFADDCESFQVEKPRYVRINTLKTTINESIEAFNEEGWTLKRYTDDSNYLGFLEAVTNLGPEEFMIDFHIPYLLIFPVKTQFYQHQAYKNGDIILQDKASCLPVYILNPELGSTILDMCAAPGMKTSQCAAVIENKGKIYAVEIRKKRFQTLKKIIESSGASCVQEINEDVLTLTSKQLPNVEYILVDPSCSGSGITDRVEIGQQDIQQDKDRLGKLAAFQITMLRYALTRFPQAKRVVYSTCSVYPEENEDVVRQVLETCTTFKLIPAAQFVDNKWENFGSPEFGNIGNYCLYAKPDIDLTSGFFVAVFERLQEGENNPFLNTKLFSRKFKTKVKKKVKEEGKEEVLNELEETTAQTVNEKIDTREDLDLVGNHGDDESIVVSKKKKKKKNLEVLDDLEATIAQTVKEEIDTRQDLGLVDNHGEDESIVVCKKKKKKKNLEVLDELGNTTVQPVNEKTDLRKYLELTDNRSEDQSFAVSKKKKKKNDRTQHEESFAELTEDNNMEEVEVQEKKKHRKKSDASKDDVHKSKKRKKEEQVKSEDVINSNVLDKDDILTSKKKKCAVIEFSEEINDVENEKEVREDKKKKKKVKNESESDKILKVAEALEHKYKKRKKAENLEGEIIGSGKKHKKSKTEK